VRTHLQSGVDPVILVDGRSRVALDAWHEQDDQDAFASLTEGSSTWAGPGPLLRHLTINIDRYGFTTQAESAECDMERGERGARPVSSVAIVSVVWFASTSWRRNQGFRSLHEIPETEVSSKAFDTPIVDTPSSAEFSHLSGVAPRNQTAASATYYRDERSGPSSLISVAPVGNPRDVSRLLPAFHIRSA
jgi:hypothetical protein